MNEYQSAINRLMCGNTAHSKDADYIKLAIKALEKQVPKKMLVISESCNSKLLECATCHERFIFANYIKPFNYCKFCGQKTDY